MEYETGTRVIDNRADRNAPWHHGRESGSALHIPRDRTLAARPQAVDARERGQSGAQGLRLDLLSFWQQRDRELARCFTVWDADLSDKSSVGVALLIMSLQNQFKGEIERKSQRHWAYSPTRHANMLSLLKRELVILKQLTECETW